MLRSVESGNRQNQQKSGTLPAASSLPPRHAAQPEGRLFRLQAMHGNQAVQRMLRGGILQRKLTINQPGDAFEQEADRVAEKVMRMPDPAATREPVAMSGTGARLQRCSCGKSASAGTQCEECKAKSMQMKRSTDSSAGIDSAPPIVHDVLNSPGRPLDASTRNFMEPRFGAEFSNVRVHTGEKASESARQIQALAYTTGKDIVFGAQQYKPESSSGSRLLAHELVHVVQQNRNGQTAGPMGYRGNVQNSLVVQRQQQVRLHASALSLQRMGDVSKRPVDLSCPLPTSSPASVVTVLFGLNSKALTALGVADIAAFIARWKAAGTGPQVRIDGFASTDGPDSLNWTLSCDRAETVANELQHPTGGGAGIPSGSIDIFASGETSEFSSTSLEQNRRATISANLAVPPAPVCANPGESRSLDLQPVFLRTSAADPSPTGASWAPRFNAANTIWGKIGVTFVDLGAVTLDTPLKAGGTNPVERATIRGLRSAAGVEVFLVDNDLATVGGADTLPSIGAGCGATGNIVMSDRGTSNTLLAHELGHILGIDHPTQRPPFNAGDPGTIMEPSGSNSTANPTRNTMVNFSRILCPAANSSTCLNPDT